MGKSCLSKKIMLAHVYFVMYDVGKHQLKVRGSEPVNATYKSFSRIAELYQGDSETAAICTEYQQSHDDVLLCYMYVQNFPVILNLAKKYFHLTDNDKESFAVEELRKAMLDFNPSKGSQLTTLFYTYYNRRLYAESSQLRYNKRRLNYDTTTLDSAQDVSNPIAENRYADIELEEALRHQAGLTDNEVKYCTFVIREEGHIPTNTEAARAIGVTNAAITYIKRSLAKKLPAVIFA